MKAQSEQMYSSTHSQCWHYKGVGGQHQAQLLYSPERNPAPIVQAAYVGLGPSLDRRKKSCQHLGSIPGPSSS